MDSVKMSPRPSAHILQDIERLSKDQVTLSGDNFVSGEVVGINENSLVTKLSLDDAVAEGAAVGVIYGYFDASEKDVPGIMHARLTAVLESKLVWPDGITPEQKAGFLAQLAAKHIIAR